MNLAEAAAICGRLDRLAVPVACPQQATKQLASFRKVRKLLGSQAKDAELRIRCGCNVSHLLVLLRLLDGSRCWDWRPHKRELGLATSLQLIYWRPDEGSISWSLTERINDLKLLPKPPSMEADNLAAVYEAAYTIGI